MGRIVRITGVLEEIRSRWAGGEGLVAPHYEQYSLLNLASSMARALGGRSNHPPIEALKPLAEGVRRVVLVVLDSLSYSLMRTVLKKVEKAITNRSVEGVLLPLTSTFPSTTVTALTTLCTATAPLEHGLIGGTLYVRDLGGVVNLLSFAPFVGGRRESLAEGGEEVLKVLTPSRTLFHHLAEEGVKGYALLRRHLAGSGLSSLIHTGAEVKGCVGASDIFAQARRLAEAEDQAFIYAYWDPLDGICHQYGPESEEAEIEAAASLRALYEAFISRIAIEAFRETLLLVVGDHGHAQVDLKKALRLADHPELVQRLFLPATGELRAAYLHPRAGEARWVRRYLEEKLPGSVTLIPTRELVEQGYLGRGRPHPALRDRMGELLILPGEGRVVLYPYLLKEEPQDLKGAHGGLSEEEMLVPLLALRGA
jgi:hypothetical protein